MYDSNKKLVSQYDIKKGVLTYNKKSKSVKKDKKVKEAIYRSNGNLVYLKRNGTVKEINCLTLKTKTLYKKCIKKLIPKNGFVVKVKTRSNKVKKLK